MSSQIGEEAMLILMSIYGGLILIICYDVVRIFRRIFPAGIFRVITEDIIYWTIASIYMFNIFLKYNYGMPRFFSVIMVLGTMVMFESLVGRHLIDKLSKIMRKIIIFAAKPLKKVLKMIKLLFNKGNKNIKKIKEKKHATGKQKKSNHKAQYHKAKQNTN